MAVSAHQVSPQAALFTLDNSHSALVVGLGLIGRAMARQLSLRSTSMIHYSSLSTSRWQDADLLVRELGLLIDKAFSGEDKLQQLDVIWCAGQAGIGASSEAMANEQRFFLASVAGLLATMPEQITFNLVSSAGGIDTNRQHLNPYGESKLAQEQYISKHAKRWRIFRLSSAYGVPEVGVRLGLVATMLRNASLSLPTTVFADPETRRDFILVDDIARHMVARVENNSDSMIETIASGRSIGLQNLGALLEKALQKKVKLNYMAKQTNERDIVIPPSLLPHDLKLTSMEEGLRILVARSRTGFASVAALPSNNY